MAVLNFDIKSITLPSGEEGKAVFLTGSIDASTNQAFEKRLTDILSSGTKHVLLVLTNVKYINSTGLGTIVKCVDTFREKGGDIKLVGVPTKVIALFEMLGLLALFETYETIDAAVASYTKKKKDEKAAAAPTVKFPIQFRHPVTGMGLNVSQPGRFKDPRSGDYFSVDASGTIEFYEMGKVRMSEVKLPAQFDLAAALAPLASGLCQACGLPNALSSNLQAALARVSSAIQAKATDSSEMCQVILVADPEKLQVGIVNYGNGLNLRGDDPVLRELSKMVSEAKHQPLPTRGHLLTLVVRK